jgi:hypothetical protein
MKRNPTSLLLLVAGTMFLFSCRKGDIKDFFDKEHSSKYNTFKGPQVQMGNGHARSWITIDHAGVPNEIAMEITASGIEGLPHGPAEYVLPLHQKALDVTSFEHLVINWAPEGHPPGGVFTVPHFDLHFYTIPNAARLAIPEYPMAMEAFDKLPPDGYIPEGYMPEPGGIPQMGKHWVDGSVAPGTFTKTMIYGSYDGKVHFVEPMITVEVFQKAEAFSLAYAQPTLFAEHTYYPTRYNFYAKDEKYYVTLTEFVMR